MSLKLFTRVSCLRLLSRQQIPRLTHGRRCFSANTKAPASHQVVGDYGLESVRDMFDLKDKSFVVTGGGRGIGYAITRAIAEMGGNVAVLDVMDEPVSDWEALPQIVGREMKLEYIKTEVTEEKSLRDAFSKAINALGTIDGCVTAVGVSLDKPFEEQTWEEVARVQNTNVLGTFFSAQYAVKQMRKQGAGGSIVMLSSISAHGATPGHQLAGYIASNGAVRSLSVGLSVELAQDQIRCNAISPGLIDTPMTEKLRDQRPHLAEIMENTPPMKRIGNRNDLTGAVIYLLSDASKYTTGTDILITGGLHAGRVVVGDSP